MARGRKRNKEVARVDMKNGVYGGCKDYNTRCTSGEFLSSFLFFFFFAFLRSFRSLFLFSLSSRFLRDFCAVNGLDVLVSYKVKINFLIQRLIESSRCVSHIGASGARSLFFFFHQIRFSKLIDQLCRPARSKRTRGKKGK